MGSLENEKLRKAVYKNEFIPTLTALEVETHYKCPLGSWNTPSNIAREKYDFIFTKKKIYDFIYIKGNTHINVTHGPHTI